MAAKLTHSLAHSLTHSLTSFCRCAFACLLCLLSQLAISKAHAAADATLSLRDSSYGRSSFKLCSLKCALVSDDSYMQPFYSGAMSSGVDAASAPIPSSADFVAAGLTASKVKVKVECILTVKVDN